MMEELRMDSRSCRMPPLASDVCSTIFTATVTPFHLPAKSDVGSECCYLDALCANVSKTQFICDYRLG